nr:hemerythrin domain-containing protein [Myxococcaceae bacterium]
QAVKQPNAYPVTDPRAMSSAALMFHIVSRHHAYLRDVLAIAAGLSLKVERVHQGREAPLGRVRAVVHELRALLEPHIEHEEAVLFPALLEHSLTPEELSREAADSKTDHERTSALFSELRRLTWDYTPPSWACSSLRGLYHQLEGLEADTLEHVHLENYVLFPRLAAQRRAQHGAT